MRTGLSPVRGGGSGASRGRKPHDLRICSCAVARALVPRAFLKYHGASPSVGVNNGAVSQRFRRTGGGTAAAAGAVGSSTGRVASGGGVNGSSAGGSVPVGKSGSQRCSCCGRRAATAESKRGVKRRAAAVAAVASRRIGKRAAAAACLSLLTLPTDTPDHTDTSRSFHSVAGSGTDRQSRSIVEVAAGKYHLKRSIIGRNHNPRPRPSPSPRG